MGFLNSVVTSIAPIFIATSPITSYADQIYSIHRTRSSAGFSLDIPLIMLVSSILKVFYYPGTHYALSLLVQALLMICMHTLLLHIALRHRAIPPSTHAPFASLQPSSSRRPYNFWQWPSPKPYWSFLALFFSTLLVLHIVLSPTTLFPAYTSLLGTLALSIEAVLPLPQLWTNYTRRNCRGFRVSVIFNWVLGDVFKMWFFFASGSGEGGVPWAFKACGVFQACCDAGLAGQWWWYGDGVEGVENVKGKHSPPVSVGGVGDGGVGFTVDAEIDAYDPFAGSRAVVGGGGEKGVGIDIPLQEWEKRG
ncbi:hypothetical protein GQ43DRAFT_481036 [Delitschia confertaspora ATCC 74209]|uniref:PQ loop repeat protein n=1 Tax=Delitschia confertaspora ATCC 74209 TaxID=1513339 RepID=A0A9P4JMK8_9PLEO|nr:hypothetical protein GQ43DRAFT_481036 [Delitschia confertaspora ATCC 74209]